MVKSYDLPTALRCATRCIYGSEGFTATAFLDKMAKVPVWTIGHGTTMVAGEPVRPGMVCTREQADEWAAADMAETAAQVLAAVCVRLNDSQLAALISLAYNIGIGAFRRSSVLEALNLAMYSIAAQNFLEYDHADGVVVPGLLKRRQRERALFLTSMGLSPYPDLQSQLVADQMAMDEPMKEIAIGTASELPTTVSRVTADDLNALELKRLQSLKDPDPEQNDHMSVLTDCLAAAAQGAASVYHGVVATGQSMVTLSAADPEVAALIAKGVAYANAILASFGLPEAVLSVTEDLVLTAIKALAASDPTVKSGT